MSFVFTNYFYTGGAHGNHNFFTKNFYVKDGKAISINAYRSESQDFDKEWVKNGIEQITAEVILIKERSLEIFFAPYAVTAYAFGDFKVEIPFYKLSKFLDKTPSSLYSQITAYEYEET